MPADRSVIRAGAGPAMLLLLAGLGAASCASMPPEQRALVYRPDFSSPEATGRSFLAAWADEQPQTEYRALSEAWKREVGGTLDAYLLARPRLRQQIGWSGRHAWRLQPLSRETTDDGLIVWWGLECQSPLLGLAMVSQRYLEFAEAGDEGRRPGTYLDGSLEEYYGFDGSTVWIEVSDPIVRSASRLPELRRIELGVEWKIRGLLRPEPTADRDGGAAPEPLP